MTQVTAFLQDGRCQGIVRDYADALGSYVRGLLVKDQGINTGVTLPPAEADELYASALQGLKDFQRPLTTVICGLVRFTTNDFSFTNQSTGFNRLDQCNALLSPLLDRDVSPVEISTEDTLGVAVKLCPFDQAIDRVLDLAGRLGPGRSGCHGGQRDGDTIAQRSD